jgi:trafficking protein particle complex subunit 2
MSRLTTHGSSYVDHQNSPLYIRTFEDDEDLGFHYVAHVALDIIEEKLRAASTTAAKDDMYLGFLGPIEDYRVCVHLPFYS